MESNTLMRTKFLATLTLLALFGLTATALGAAPSDAVARAAVTPAIEQSYPNR
jgi:hypothetical protein